jgi:prepilin-type N-terminal cleavage/methylation domain-containing protein
MVVPHTNKIFRRLQYSKGFTAVELLTALIIFSILSAIAVTGVLQYEKKACRVILEHDVRKFFEAETIFYGENNIVKGDTGDIVSNDPTVSSTLWLEGFTPSQNTSITIVKVIPLTIVGRNKRVMLTYEYDIKSGRLTKR